MDILEKLFWERFRPNSLVPEKGKIPIILLPRIRQFVENGIITNLLFNGKGGSGKSSCAAILSQQTDCLKINCSLERGIDVIREQVEDHVRNFSLLGNKGIKTVWLDEFDNSSPDMRKGLRGFVEDYSDTVRFFATTNNLQAISRTEEDKALIGRFNVVEFDAVNKEEVDYLKTHQVSYLKSIAKAVKFEVSDEVVEKMVNKCYPNFRKAVQLMQESQIRGEYYDAGVNGVGSYEEVFSYIMDGDLNPVNVFNFVSGNYPREKTEELLLIVGRPFFKYLMDNDPVLIQRVGTGLIAITKEHCSQYTSTIDPEVHLMNCILKMKELFVKK